jgi:inorganic phosphate transporter, PiT family
VDQATVYILLAGFLGLFMALGIGANDVANAMGTSVGSRALTVRQAIVIAAVFELLGSVAAGGQVTNTIRKGIIDAELLAGSPDLLVCGMLAALLAAGIWLLVASWAGWPVSTTHSIVGAIVGFAAVGLGVSAVQWGKVGSIVMSWVVSPVLAGAIAFALFRSVQRLILDTADPFSRAKTYVPIYMFLVGFVVTLVTLLKGLKHVGLELSTAQSYAYATLCGAVLTALGAAVVRRVKEDPQADRDFHFASVERVFGVLMMVTACAMAFAHGSNDVANAIGPVAAVVSVAQSGGTIATEAAVPFWILLIGGVGIVLGLVLYGYRVMATVGTRITDLTPSRGFAATLAAAMTVVFASGTGLPISTTHTLVGAILGVGVARGMAAIDMSVVRMIFMSWVITLPAGAFLAVIFFYVFRAVLT